jgi:hypothetical protein
MTRASRGDEQRNRGHSKSKPRATQDGKIRISQWRERMAASFGSKFGSREERHRLAQLYAALPDGELQQLAREAGSLTEEASAALALEMARRKMPEETAEPDDAAEPGGEHPAFRDLLTIRQFRDLPEALLAKSVLESAGIECFLGDDNLIRMDWLWSNLLGGIKLRVRQ